MGLEFAPGGSFASTQVLALNSGQQFAIPQGNWKVNLSKYHNLQKYDPITTTWRGVGSANEGAFIEDLYSDGVNYRLVNTTGSAVGALLTNAGSGYTSAPTVTPSAGGSKWVAVVGGAVSTTVTVVAGGSNYTYPPLVVFSLPPSPGIPATGYATLSSGAVSAITIVDQGAGYTSPPTITLLNDPRELANPLLTDGYGAVAVCALTGAQTVTAVLNTDSGQGSLATLPTLAFSGGGGASAAATVIMNWTITAFAISTAGAGLAGSFAEITALDNFPTTAPAYTNPSMQSNLLFTRPATIKAAVSAGALTLTGSIVQDGGAYTSSPNPLVLASASAVTTAPVVTFTLGGVAGTSYISPI